MSSEHAFVGRDLAEFPLSEVAQPASVLSLDLSANHFADLSFLASFPHLSTLVLDSNGIDESVLATLPNRMKSVETLWLNRNALSDLVATMDVLAPRLPSVAYLSFLFNPVCPFFDDAEEYSRYRLYAVYRFPKLKFLDSTEVQPAERMKASRVGEFLTVHRPAQPRPAEKDGRLSDATAKKEEPEELDADTRTGRASAFAGISRGTYNGKASEGNRFIRNTDL